MSAYGFSNISFVESILNVFFISVLFLMMKGQSAKCVEGPIRIIKISAILKRVVILIVQNFFLLSLIRSIYVIIIVDVYWQERSASV